MAMAKFWVIYDPEMETFWAYNKQSTPTFENTWVEWPEEGVRYGDDIYFIEETGMVVPVDTLRREYQDMKFYRLMFVPLMYKDTDEREFFLWYPNYRDAFPIHKVWNDEVNDGEGEWEI